MDHFSKLITTLHTHIHTHTHTYTHTHTHEHIYTHTHILAQRFALHYANGGEPSTIDDLDDEDGTIPAHEMAKRLASLLFISYLKDYNVESSERRAPPLIGTH